MANDQQMPQFVDAPIAGVDFRSLNFHQDARGWLIELYREDELPPERRPMMAYISQTLPGVVRGPHEHCRQTDRFVFVGPGDFRLYLWDGRKNSSTFQHRQVVLVGQSHPQAVVIPPGVVHAYRNVSAEPGMVINLPNRLYGGWERREFVDEIRYEHSVDGLYVVD